VQEFTSKLLCKTTWVSVAEVHLTYTHIKMIKSKIRWGDTLDDEDALPPTTVKGPDSHGIKITTEYYKNDKGESIKKVTKVKVVNVEKKVYKVGAWNSSFSHSAMQAAYIVASCTSVCVDLVYCGLCCPCILQPLLAASRVGAT
jgi:hypothetical protein